MYKVNVKWGKEMFSDVELNTNESPYVFKVKLQSLSGVPPERQKVILKGVTVSNDWSNVEVKDGVTVLLMGTKAENVPSEPVVKTCFIEDMTEDEIAKVSDLPAGLANLGNTCYLNATVQCLKTVPELREALRLFKGKFMEGTITAESVVVAMRDLYDVMDNEAFIPPVMLLHVVHILFPRFAIKNEQGVFMQQDASECWTELIRVLQQIVPSINKTGFETKHKHFIDQYFGGVFEIEYTCTESSDESPIKRDETFLHLSCFIAQDVKYMMYGIKSQLVENITKTSEVLGRNAVFSKSSKIKRLPAYLTIQFIRFFYKEKGSVNAKILKDVKFPFEFDAFELCTPQLKARLTPMRQKFEDFENYKFSDSNAKMSGENLKTLPFSFEDDLGSNNSGYYTLQAVLTHMGRSSNSGHYVAWIRHSQNNTWIKCDDKTVTPISEEAVSKLSGGHGDWHCAYVLLYGPKTLQVPLDMF